MGKRKQPGYLQFKTREEMNQQIVTLYAKKIPFVDIADRLNISFTDVEIAIKQAGVEVNIDKEETHWKAEDFIPQIKKSCIPGYNEVTDFFAHR